MTKSKSFSIFLTCTLAISLFISLQSYGQKADSLLVGQDTTQIKQDSIQKADTLKVPESKNALKSPILYKAQDSVIYDIKNKQVMLYGNANVHYQGIDLTAAEITYSWKDNTLSARPGRDSAGKPIGYPIFKQGNTSITTRTIQYNFISKKGRVSDLITQQGEGYLRGDTVKTVQEGKRQVSYVKNGIYTTCDYAQIPGHAVDYYFKAKKIKVIAGDKIITGMADLYIEGVPTPLILPFGFFPSNSRKTSGIIPPSVLYSQTKGYALHGGGFYLAASPYYDLALTTDFYTKGDYMIQGVTHYARRYHFNGSVLLSIARNSYGLEQTPGYHHSEDYNFQWTHAEDPKAHPGTSFNAYVNFPSSHYIADNLYYTSAVLTQNVNSSISYAKMWAGSPFSLNISAKHSIRLNNSTTGTRDTTPNMNLTLPEGNFSMSRIYPFKRETGKKRWYSDIGLSGNFNFQNAITTTDSTFTKDILNYDNYKNGGTISIPLSTSFKALKWFSLTPSLNYNGYLYTRRTLYKNYNRTDSVVALPQQGFYMANEGNAALGISTHVYGLFKINKGRIVAIRHVITPTLAAVYRPDFGKPQYGYYRQYIADSTGTIARYSPYAGGSTIGPPPTGAEGALNFGLDNNFEMKLRTAKDTSQSTKKIKLLDRLDITGSYNFLDTSFYKLSVFNMYASTTILNNYTLQLNATLNPYVLDSQGARHPGFEWKQRHRLGTFTNATLSAGATLKAEKNKTGTEVTAYNPLYDYFYREPYVDFSIPFNASVNFNLLYNRFGNPAKKFTETVYINGSFYLTPKWQISLNTGYDFSAKQVSLTQINIHRDLHCWEAGLQWTPFGPYRSYLFNLNIKASALSQLKISKQKAYYDF